MIIKYLKRIKVLKPPKLGRWAVCSEDVINRKIDLANTDYCGISKTSLGTSDEYYLLDDDIIMKPKHKPRSN